MEKLNILAGLANTGFLRPIQLQYNYHQIVFFQYNYNTIQKMIFNEKYNYNTIIAYYIAIQYNSQYNTIQGYGSLEEVVRGILC